MQFVFPTLAWGFLLVLVPLLVHLINLLRHRRQPWAAMEFLLESYRKHRKWVWLKQALLLLSRMAAMALLVAMLAHWVSGSRLMTLLGQNVTHHYILLDDSFSMADEVSGTSAYSSGLSAIGGILRQAAEDRGTHQVTLLRWSRAFSNQASEQASEQTAATKDAATKTEASSGESVDQVSVDTVADLLARSVPSDPEPLLEKLRSTLPTALELSCDASLRMIQPLIQSASMEQAVVYVVSDFRKKDWDQPETIKTSLAQLANQGASIQLIDCVDAQHQNLTVVDIQPEQEVLASGVPTFVRVTVRNNGSTPARNVQVRMKMVDYGGPQATPKLELPFSGDVTELPSIVVDQIAPGETVTRQNQVLFSRAGSQVVRAELPADSVATDNSASCVLRISDGQPILLVDADPDQKSAFYMESVLNPGSSAKTGFLVPREDVAYLRDCQPSELDKFSAIVLMNVGRLDARALSNLETYVASGGGLTVIPGSKLSAVDFLAFGDVWYRDGQGLLPAKIDEPVDLTPSDSEGNVDIVAENHPIFQPLLGLSNSPFQAVRVSRYIPVVPSGDGSGGFAMRPETRIVAKLRNNAPFILDAPFGKGRVILMLTSLETTWSNWPQDPTFVVATLKMMGYLGSFRREATNERVGSAMQLTLSSREYLPDVSLVLPGAGAGQRIGIDQIAKDDGKSSWNVTLRREPGMQTEDLYRAVTSPGVFEFWTTKLQGERQVFNFAHNVSSTEGDLSKIASAELLQNLRPVNARYRTADSVSSSSLATTLSSSTTILMILLLLVLLFEQFLAWSTSFHLPKAGQRGGV